MLSTTHCRHTSQLRHSSLLCVALLAGGIGIVTGVPAQAMPTDLISLQRQPWIGIMDRGATDAFTYETGTMSFSPQLQPPLFSRLYGAKPNSYSRLSERNTGMAMSLKTSRLVTNLVKPANDIASLKYAVPVLPPRLVLVQSSPVPMPAANAVAPAGLTVASSPAALVAQNTLVASSAPQAVASEPPIRRSASGEPLVTNSFADTDLKQALSDVTAQTGVPIIADNTVQGTVTLDLKDVPLERALAMLLQVGGFAFTKIDDYYLVGAPESTNPNFYLLSRTEIVQLKNIRPEVVLSMLSVPYGRYLSSEGSTPIVSTRGSSSDDFRRSVNGGFGGNSGRNEGASADVGRPAPTYKIAITAPPTLIPRIKADIARLDQSRRQVMLEAQVLEISQDDLRNIGFNFATRFLQFNTTGGGTNFAYSSVTNKELVQLAALAQKGVVKVRATPRVTTGDGQTAEMEVGRENYFSITSGAINLAYNTLEVIRSGISLRITPRVLEDENEVQALVEPEVRDVTGSSSNGLPEITFRRAATNVRVKDGQSIVIGGLMNEYDAKTNSKIPVLGNLPIFGGLFRGTNSRKLRIETVIIVTPHILQDDTLSDGVVSPILRQDLTNHRADNSRFSPITSVPLTSASN